MKKNWQIRGSLIYLLTLVMTIIGLIYPVIPGVIMPLIGLIVYFRLKSTGHIKSFDWKEIALLILYTIIMVGGSVYLQIIILAQIPWWQLILIGIAADVYASTIGTIPIWGDFTAGLLAFAMASIVAPGITGLIIGLGMAIICILPGPSLGANTIYLIIFKILSLLIT